MSRSVVGVAGWIGAIAGIGCLAACGGSQASDAVIGAPGAAVAAASPTPASDSAASLQQALTNELNQAALTQTVNEQTPLLIQVNALANDPSLILAEKFSALEDIGAQAAAKREKTLQNLIGDLRNDSYLDSVDVAGQNLRRGVIDNLNAVSAGVTALATKIATDSLIDVLRVDVIAMLTGTRVYGFYEPITHIEIAGGDVLYEADQLFSRSRDLLTRITAGAATDPNAGRELELSNNLLSSIATINVDATGAIESVQGLSASAYPSNRTSITDARGAIAALKADNGALTTALQDASEINYLLGLAGH